MAQTHTFFATAEDIKIVLSWLRDAGAETVGSALSTMDDLASGKEVIFHFPLIGPLEFWPDEIRLTDYPENSARWRLAVLTRDHQARNPHRRLIDSDRSAVAVLLLPEFRERRFWVASRLAFSTSRLRTTFPELSRICQRLERRLRRFPTVFDSTRGEDVAGFQNRLCMSGVIQRVVAFPEAFAILQENGFMVDHMASPRQYSDSKQSIELGSFDG